MAQNSIVKSVEETVKSTISRYRLLNRKEKILVACSGGKDSTTVLHVLSKMGYNVEAVSIDVMIGNYSKKNMENIKKFCRDSRIKLHIISFREKFGGSFCYLASVLKSRGIKLNNCAICGVLRRYLLNREARILGADKIVTGHNLDDEAQAFMMNLVRNTLQLSARLGPASGMKKDRRFIPRVKPLYFLAEKEIEEYSKAMAFPVKYSRCPCSADVFRRNIGKMLDSLEKDNPEIKRNIVDYFQALMPKLRKRYEQAGNQNYCKECGEPSKSSVCRTCQIISHLKPKN